MACPPVLERCNVSLTCCLATAMILFNTAGSLDLRLLFLFVVNRFYLSNSTSPSSHLRRLPLNLLTKTRAKHKRKPHRSLELLLVPPLHRRRTVLQGKRMKVDKIRLKGLMISLRHALRFVHWHCLLSEGCGRTMIDVNDIWLSLFTFV